MRMMDQTFKQDGGIGTYLDKSLEKGYVPYTLKSYFNVRFFFDLLFFLLILLIIFQDKCPNKNKVLLDIEKYDINELEYLTNNNFEKLYNSFNLNKLNELNIFCDSEDEDTNGDIKQFSNSYKQFLKSKRALEK